MNDSQRSYQGQQFSNRELRKMVIPLFAEQFPVMLSSIVALFGTYQIAANGVAQSIWSLAALSGVAMGPVFITVIGQCMGIAWAMCMDWTARGFFFYLRMRGGRWKTFRII